MRSVALFFVFVIGMASASVEGVRAQDLTLVVERPDGTSRSVSVGEIEAIGLVTFTELDPFNDKEINYSGVPLRRFVEVFGGERATSAIFEGIDGYAYEFKRPDWQDNLYLVTRQQGKHIGHREKGPFRIVDWGYDRARLTSKYNFNDWVWMIVRVTIR